MLNNANQLPISGGVILGSLLYIGASVFIFAPIIAERTIEKSDWNAQCKTALKAKVEVSRKPRRIIPKTDCSSILGSFMPELARLCNQFNPDLGGFAANQLRQQERLRQEEEEKRLALAASQSASQCSCAASLVIQERRIWATHAASLRFITSHQIKNLTAELTQALNTSHCTGRSES